nr:hypothetical protein [Tanacetum cinerariifolium]
MRKHEYGYLEEIVVRRVDNKLYKFKEGDFLRLRINDIEDMLLFVVQNRLINLSGDDVADFAIALRMFIRSLVIQKRVKDLQLGVESYQKQIRVTKPDTTRPDLRKRHMHTPYKNPQGVIYIDDYQRNRGIQSRGYVYSTKRILAVTHVSVMRKHGYGYLEEIMVRKADNKLYKFKEGDFLQLQINGIEDMLLLVVQNQLINLSGDDVADFAIALRMLLSSLEDITKNINMEYFPKRRWSILEKKKAHYMIKDINKLLKEKRMMRSLDKFVGGRLYGTDLRLLQRTI